MKKQSLILATTFTTVAFISCNKEKIETQQLDNVEEIATAKGGGTRLSILIRDSWAVSNSTAA